MTKRNTALTIEEPSTSSSEILFAAQIEQQIRQRAFELYEQRGQIDGLAEQDWLQAEAEILGASSMKAAA
jgi:hypothetical protein